jgi:GNAT superfamily N-acetyltransferase
MGPKTWADFERLFRPHGGVQAGCWCMFYHRAGPTGPLASAARQRSNRGDHRALALRGRAHGVIVYDRGRPVGWCQFGLREDLPRIENGRRYRAMAGSLGGPPRWRITCFFVDKPSRRSGVAGFALRAALAAMRVHGGGTVEAYPATHPEAVALWFGTVGMFERAGFRRVRPFGRSNVLMRRTLRARTARSARPRPSALVG